MKKFLLTTVLVLLAGVSMAQEATYKYTVTDTKLTSSELNAKTEPTYIAIKNLSATNNYYFVGNTGATPYSKATFSDDAVFIWEPKGDGGFYLKKLDGTYMQISSPKDFGGIDNAAVFTTKNPNSTGSSSTYFNGDGDSQSFIDGNNDPCLVRFVKESNWINVQNGDNGTPTYNTGTGGWTIHYVYTVERKEVITITTEEVGNPTEDGVYRVYWKQNNRGYLAYHNDYPTKGVLADVTLSGYASSHFSSATDPVELEWYLITSEAGNKYLFSAYNGKFLTYSKESADNAKAAYFDAARPCPITIEGNTSYSGYYIIKANVDGRDCLLSSGCGTASRTGYPIRWNSNISGDMGDGGSPLIFVKVSGLDVDEAIIANAQAAINDYENPVETDVNFEWTTSTPWTAVEHSAYYTSTVFNDNELDGVKYIEGEVTVAGARTATVTFTYIDGGHKLNIRGVEVIDAMGNIVAGDYHVGTTGGSHVDNTYTVSVAEAGTYKVRCYAAEGNGDQFDHSHGSIVVSFAKLDVMELTKSVTFAAEYATLYLGYKVAIPAGVEAYVLSGVNEKWATLTQINNVIPANTAVILKGTAGSTYNFYYTSSEAEDVEINYLEGSIADRYVQGDAYVLGIPEGETEAALCPALLNKIDNTAFKNNANKAYLKVAPGMNEVSFYGFRFEGEDEENTTGIEVVENVNENVIYDLAGRRVSEITEKGIYIVNGKKVIK